MKKIIFFLAFVFSGYTSLGLAISRVDASSISLYNYSSTTFSISGFQITVNTTVYEVNNLTIISGVLNTPAGGTVVLGGISAPTGPASVALWYGATFPGTPSSAQLASFMQYGSAGQAYEAIAVSAFLWTSNTFVPGSLPFIRNGDYSNWGAANWTSTMAMDELRLQLQLRTQPNPFNHHLIVEATNRQIENVSLMSLTGQEVAHTAGLLQEEVILNTETLKNGVYLLQVTLRDGTTLIRKLSKY